MHVYEDDIYYDFDKLRLMIEKQSRQCLTREPGRHKDTNPNPKWSREIKQLRDEVIEDIVYLESISSCTTVNSEVMKTEGTFTIVAERYVE